MTLAANHNNEQAQYNLGIVYCNEQYMSCDINKSIYYMTLASRNGHEYAQAKLGIDYYKGQIVQQNIEKAIYYCSLASKKHHLYSLFFMGTLYLDGKYVKQDIDKAIHFYKEGSSFNSGICKNNLGVIYKNIKKNTGNAFEYFKEAIIKEDDYIAMYNLAHIYYFGEKDIQKSIELLIRAANKNFKFPIYILSLIFVKILPVLTIDEIANETSKYGNINEKLNNNIYLYIMISNLKDELSYQSHYASIKKTDLIYDYDFHSVSFNDFVLKNKDDGTSYRKKMMMKNIADITKSFYEGFGIDVC